MLKRIMRRVAGKWIKACGFCRCQACESDGQHYSDCAVHNMPAMPNGPCTCAGR